MRGFLCALAALLILSSPALAHHRHHHWHHHANRHERHVYLHMLGWRASWEPNAQSSILSTAREFLGERNPTHFHGRWCAAFTRFVLRLTGHRSVASNRAIDQVHDGARVRNPRPGDIAVMRHHVTFFAGWGGRGFYGLGGNQGRHRVTLSSYPVDRVLAWVRPG